MLLLVILEVVLFLGQPTSTPKYIILEETGMIGIFRNLSVSPHHPPWCYLGVGIINFALLMFFCLVLLLEMVKVAWFLGPPTLTPKKLIVGFMVTILCYQGVENILQ